MTSNLYNLPNGTEYVVIDGAAVPIRDLSGVRQGNCFYQNGETEGRFIRTRTATAREIAATKPAPAARPLAAAFTLSDWK